MRITWSPQRSDRTLTYDIDGETITAKLDPEQLLVGAVWRETYDFSELPDGELDVSLLEATMDPCPILAARRINGQLEVTLLRYHGPDAPESERFPEPEVFG